MSRAIAGYSAGADALIPRYDAVAARTVLAPILGWLPTRPARVLDLGAGTGATAAWLARQGHHVTALEPVAAFRAAGQRKSPAVRWQDGTLPDLPNLPGADLGLCLAVWHHLTPTERAMGLHRMAKLVRPGGRLILSLRHGPTPADRPGHPAPLRATLLAAGRVGFGLSQHRHRPSLQPANRQAGVTWDWVCLQRVR